MRTLFKSFILAYFIIAGGMAMAAETNLVEQQTAQLKQEVALLTQQVELLKAQSALSIAQAQLPFAELQGIKAATSGLTIPKGKEGTVKVAVGTQGTALLRSKRAMLELLDTVANDLIKVCPTGAALLTEEQLGQASKSQFTLNQIKNETSLLDKATKDAKPIDTRMGAQSKSVLATAIVGAYGLGFALETINGLAKLMRTDRQLDIFDDKEAVQTLGYLLESKGKGFTANPGLLGDNAIVEADKLLEQLNDLATTLQTANDTLAKIQKYSDIITKAPANDPIRTQIKMPKDEDLNVLKAEINSATSLIEGLHPSKKPDAFWAQVKGQVLATNIQGKTRLFIEAKAQVVQVTESRWYTSDRILATGEVQVAYRLLKPDGSLEKAGIMLKASESDKKRIDELNELNWQRPL